jgi:hypothetical protein
VYRRDHPPPNGAPNARMVKSSLTEILLEGLEKQQFSANSAATYAFGTSLSTEL